MPVQEQDHNDDHEPRRPQWESEIRDIFEASERDPSLTDKVRSKATRARYGTRTDVGQRIQATRGRTTTGSLMLIVLVLAVSGFALRHVSPLLGQLLAFAALIAFVLLLYKAFFGDRNTFTGPMPPSGKGPSGTNPTIESWKNRIRRDDEP